MTMTLCTILFIKIFILMLCSVLDSCPFLYASRHMAFCLSCCKCFINCITPKCEPLVYNQSCKVCEDTHLFVPTLLLRGNQTPERWDYKLELWETPF